ncbi:MAG: TIGR04255 family protein [Nitrospiraceae bacterium]
MSEAASTSPDFDDPPVIETALGVEFSPLKGWDVQHFGLFWREIRNEYPHVQVVPPARGHEDEPPQSVPRIELVTHLPTRCWFVNGSRTRLIQIQNDRFFHNWRKAGSTEVYPHYETIRPVFERDWLGFIKFLESERLTPPDVKTCEITYVNHLEMGKGWDSFADLSSVISLWQRPSEARCLTNPEVVAISARYLLSGNTRLSISVTPGIRDADATEILQLTLTARGGPSSSEIADLWAWFDPAREALGRAFLEITTERMHKVWRRTR